MCYRTPDGTVGQAKSGIWASSQAGLLWFFDRENAEVLVKVLNGCAHNGHRWVYVAPVTDLEFNLWITGPNGQRWIHSNAQGTTASTKADTRAFQCSTEVGGGSRIGSLSVEPARLMPAQAGKPGEGTILVTVVDDAGSPVGGASYRWSTDRHSGWAHPPHGTTGRVLGQLAVPRVCHQPRRVPNRHLPTPHPRTASMIVRMVASST